MQDNQYIVRELFDRFSQRDWDGALALLSDDVSWRLPGKPERFPSAGDYDKARLKRLFQRMDERLETSLVMRVIDILADGDRLAVEVESTGDLKMVARTGSNTTSRFVCVTARSRWFASTSTRNIRSTSGSPRSPAVLSH